MDGNANISWPQLRMRMTVNASFAHGFRILRYIGPTRPCFEFRVTSVQNHRGSGPRSNNSTGVIFGMIHFSAGLLLSEGQSSTLTVKLKSVHLTRKCHNQKYMQGVQDRIENLFEGGSDFTEDGSFG